MKNKYEIRGDVTAIILNRKDGTKHETIISTDRLLRANEFPNTWFTSRSKNDKSYYVYGTLYKNGKKITVLLHRWLLEPIIDGLMVDHINHNTLDNREINLRIVNSHVNQLNRSGANKNTVSGIRGVTWRKDSKKWMVRVYSNGKFTHLGCYDLIEDAINVAEEARKKYGRV